MKNERKFKDKLIIFAITLCLCIMGVYSTALANEDINTITIIDDGNVGTYVCDKEDSATKLLIDNGFDIKEGDKVDLSDFDEEKTIKISRAKTVYINDMKNISSYVVYSTSLSDVLSEINLDTEKYRVLTIVEEPIKEGLVIEVAQNFEITLKLNGKQKKLSGYYGETLSQLLNSSSIQVGDKDYIDFRLNDMITENRNIEIKNADITTKVISESISYDTEVKYNSSIPAGKKKVIQKGKNGTKTITKQIVSYYDNKNAEETVLSEKVEKSPVNEIIEIGTKISSSDKTYNNISVGDIITGRKTHYCACGICGSGSGITASGLRVSNGMKNPYIIACNWLPMGAVVDIDGVIYTVADRGGSGLSTVGRVDIFTPEGHAACYKKGTGSCTITILSL